MKAMKKPMVKKVVEKKKFDFMKMVAAKKKK